MYFYKLTCRERSFFISKERVLKYFDINLLSFKSVYVLSYNSNDSASKETSALEGGKH